ncbi:fasciclin-3-like isoform X2 [Chironomus tepperi]|uniref:fasciclin-3-like isoform X2 n=1 Tax=Chironomus tepperi TaxID=113505 RepID=UPI00391F83C3
MVKQRRTILDTIPMVAAIFFVAIISIVECQRIASTTPEKVTGQEGQKVELLCTFGKPIDRCSFEFPNGDRPKLSPAFPPRPDYKYFGSGLENGQCGVTVEDLKATLEGNVTCRLDLGDGSDDIIGIIPIEIAKPPNQPILFVQNDRKLEAGQEMEAECEYRDGQPHAKVSWFLGSERIIPKNEEFVNNEKKTVISVVSHRLSADDNLKSLVCRLDHPAFQNGYTNTSMQLNVNYQPMALSRDELYISGLEIGRTVDIVLRLRANPRPRLQWTIEGNNYDEGRQTNKYQVYTAEQDEEGKWIAKLTVIDLSLEDTMRTYMLRASNEFGANDYSVRIGGSQELDDSGLGIVPIIGITVISVFVLIVVALLVVARVTKRWCFADFAL